MKKYLKWLSYKVRWGNSIKICYGCNINPTSTFGGMNQIHKNSYFIGHLGYGSYIGEESILWAEIGKFCSISNRVISNCGIHPYKEPFVTTAPCFYSKNINHYQNGSTFATKQKFNEIRSVNNEGKYGIKIGNDVWIGEGVFINGGITISDGAMILAHAVITKDIPPYAIVGGVPGKIIGYRFDQETIDWLLKIKWWDNTENWFKNNWELLCDINKLKNYYKNNTI